MSANTIWINASVLSDLNSSTITTSGNSPCFGDCQCDNGRICHGYDNAYDPMNPGVCACDWRNNTGCGNDARYVCVAHESDIVLPVPECRLRGRDYIPQYDYPPFKPTGAECFGGAIFRQCEGTCVDRTCQCQPYSKNGCNSNNKNNDDDGQGGGSGDETCLGNHPNDVWEPPFACAVRQKVGCPCLKNVDCESGVCSPEDGVCLCIAGMQGKKAGCNDETEWCYPEGWDYSSDWYKMPYTCIHRPPGSACPQNRSGRTSFGCFCLDGVCQNTNFTETTCLSESIMNVSNDYVFPDPINFPNKHLDPIGPCLPPTELPSLTQFSSAESGTNMNNGGILWLVGYTIFGIMNHFLHT